MGQRQKRKANQEGALAKNSDHGSGAVSALQKLRKREFSSRPPELDESLGEGLDIIKNLGVVVEIEDEETGIPVILFVQGEDSYTARKKADNREKEKRRKARALHEWVEEFKRMLERMFKEYRGRLFERIESIEKNVKTRIKAYDNAFAKVGNAANTKGKKDSSSAFKEEKGRFQAFLDRLKKRKEDLEKAESTEELLEIEAELEEDVVTFDEKRPLEEDREKIRIAAFFSSLFAAARSIPVDTPATVEEEPPCAPFDEDVYIAAVPEYPEYEETEAGEEEDLVY